MGAADRDRAINACVCANRGEAGIVLIYVDWVPTGWWCVMPALSRRVRGRGGEAALAANVIVHGPAARSLTSAATGGALKEQKVVRCRKRKDTD